MLNTCDSVAWYGDSRAEESLMFFLYCCQSTEKGDSQLLWGKHFRLPRLKTDTHFRRIPSQLRLRQSSTWRCQLVTLEGEHPLCTESLWAGHWFEEFNLSKASDPSERNSQWLGQQGKSPSHRSSQDSPSLHWPSETPKVCLRKSGRHVLPRKAAVWLQMPSLSLWDLSSHTLAAAPCHTGGGGHLWLLAASAAWRQNFHLVKPCSFDFTFLLLIDLLPFTPDEQQEEEKQNSDSLLPDLPTPVYKHTTYKLWQQSIQSQPSPRRPEHSILQVHISSESSQGEFTSQPKLLVYPKTGR